MTRLQGDVFFHLTALFLKVSGSIQSGALNPTENVLFSVGFMDWSKQSLD